MLTQRRRGKTQQQLLSLHKNGEDFQTSSRGVFESSIDNQIQNHLQVLRPVKYDMVNIKRNFFTEGQKPSLINKVGIRANLIIEGIK